MPSRTSGFTLMELMIVITIIAVSAALAMPALQSAMAERRAGQAALDVVRLARRARAEAMAYGRAHVLVYSAAAPGSIQLYRGVNSGCNTNNWPAIFGGPACGAVNSMCIDEVNLASSQYTGGSHSVQFAAPGADLQICVTPSGTMMWRNGGAAPFSGVTVAGSGFRFQIQRSVDGTVEGVDRWVVIPFGGTARILR